jgi:hypothetical protein
MVGTFALVLSFLSVFAPALAAFVWALSRLSE